MASVDEIRARLAAYTELQSERVGDYHDAWRGLTENMLTDYAYLLGAADDAQDAIYVLAGCVAKEREENDRFQARLHRAEELIRLCSNGHCAGWSVLSAFLSEGQQ